MWAKNSPARPGDRAGEHEREAVASLADYPSPQLVVFHSSSLFFFVIIVTIFIVAFLVPAIVV